MTDRNFSYLSADMISTQPTKGLFVGDLSSSTTERDLQILFGSFGQVVAVEVKRGRHGDSLLHGFVEFDCESSAFSAIQKLNGIKFKGRKMRVNWTNTKVVPNAEAESWIQVQVNFSSKNTASHVNEELLETIFSQYGKIADVMVKRQIFVTDPVQLSGYGFVFFFDVASAFNAVATMKSIAIDGIVYECVLGTQKKEEKKIPSPPAASPNHVFNQHQLSIGNRDYHHGVASGRNNIHPYSSHQKPSSLPYSLHQQPSQRVVSHGTAPMAEKYHPLNVNRGMFAGPPLRRADQSGQNPCHDNSSNASMQNRLTQQQLQLQQQHQRAMFSDRLPPAMKGKTMSLSYHEQLMMQQREEELFARESRARAFAEQMYQHQQMHDMSFRNNAHGNVTGHSGLWTNEFNQAPSPFWQDGVSGRAQPLDCDLVPESPRFPLHKLHVSQSPHQSMVHAAMGMSSIFTEEESFYTNQGQKYNLMADSKSPPLFSANQLESSCTSVATYSRSSPTFSEGRNSLNHFGQGSSLLFDNESFPDATNTAVPFLDLSTLHLNADTTKKSLLPNGILDFDGASALSLPESLSSTSRSSDRWTLGGF